MYPLKINTNITVPIFAHDANGDAVTGLLTGDWTKRISKAGGAFGAMGVTITEMEGGWYQVSCTAGHLDTLGIVSMYFTHASTKQVNLQFRVHTRLPDELAFPSVAGRAFDVTSAGEVAIDLDNTNGSLAYGTEITGLNNLSAASAGIACWTTERTIYTTASSFGAFTNQMPTVSTSMNVGNLLGNVLGTVASVSGSVYAFGSAIYGALPAGTISDFDNAADQVIVATNNDKTDYALSAAGVDAVHDEVVEGTTTFRQAFKIMMSALFGKSSGGGTANLLFRDTGDTKNRIAATVDADGNRTAMTLDGS